MSVQGTQVHVDLISGTFIDLIPLTECLNCVITDLVLKLEDHVPVIGFIQTVDRRLKTVSGLNGQRWVFSSEETVIHHLRVRDQSFALCATILHFG